MWFSCEAGPGQFEELEALSMLLLRRTPAPLATLCEIVCPCRKIIESVVQLASAGMTGHRRRSKTDPERRKTRDGPLRRG